MSEHTAKVYAHQPMPVKNDREAIQDMVIADIHARKVVGIERYGTALQAFNGRDALMDAYQEALDLAVYLRQEIEERGTMLDLLKRLRGWDMLDACADGPFWKAEIDAVLA